LQRYQSKVLRIITNALCYVTSDTFHHDLKIPTIKETIEEFCQRYRDRLESKEPYENKRNGIEEKTQKEEIYRSTELVATTTRISTSYEVDEEDSL